MRRTLIIPSLIPFLWAYQIVLPLPSSRSDDIELLRVAKRLCLDHRLSSTEEEVDNIFKSLVKQVDTFKGYAQETIPKGSVVPIEWTYTLNNNPPFLFYDRVMWDISLPELASKAYIDHICNDLGLNMFVAHQMALRFQAQVSKARALHEQRVSEKGASVCPPVDATTVIKQGKDKGGPRILDKNKIRLLEKAIAMKHEDATENMKTPEAEG